MLRWLMSSLSRKLLFALSVGLLLISLLFLVLFVGMYRIELEQERSQAAIAVNRLLQASLENAMLKRDLQGLRGIVQRLGQQDGIREVRITNSVGEVRFASHAALLGEVISEPGQLDGASLSTSFIRNRQGHEVLRSINPVRNKPPCFECHGSVRESPINGIVLVDYDAEAIRGMAKQSAAMLTGSGALVILAAVLGAWWLLRRQVLLPVEALADASSSIARGQLDTRTRINRHDEFGNLGRAFNSMAERLQATLDQIREHDRFLQDLIDAVPDGIRVISDDFTITKANSAYCRQVGVDPDRVLGQKCYRSSHDRKEPCIPTMVTCPLREFQSGSEPLRAIHRHVRKDGGQFEVELSAAPFHSKVAGGERLMVVEVVRDMTKQIDVSQEQRLAEIDQLASGVAHEIHNPLSSIRLALQGAVRTLSEPGTTPSELDEYLATMDGEIDKCIAITERLLKLSQPSDRSPDLVTINTAISETISLMRYEAEEKGINLETRLDPGEPRSIASDSEVRMVVLNLVQNAFHAMPVGGTLKVTSRRRGSMIEVGFQDTGVGIRPEDLGRVFYPFFSRRADGVKGTGLGLPICRAIVERHGGRMRLESRVGEGTSLFATLPSADH